MTVIELINKLQNCDMADEVVLARDPEGNSFDPLRVLSKVLYAPLRGDVFIRELTPDMESQGYTAEDIYSGNDGKNAIALWS